MIQKVKSFITKRRLTGRGSHAHIEGIVDCRNPAGIELGDYVYIGPNAKLWGEGRIVIGNNVIIGPNVTMISTNHNFRGDAIPYDAAAVNKDIVIEDNVWIAANVNIIPGVTIGEGSIVGMGTTVTRDVPPLAIIGSNEQKILGHRNQEEYERAVSEGALYLKMKYGV